MRTRFLQALRRSFCPGRREFGASRACRRRLWHPVLVTVFGVCLLASVPLASAAESTQESPPPKPAVGSVSETLPRAFDRIGTLSFSDLKVEERYRTNLVPRVAPAVVAVQVGSAMGSAVIISPDGVALCAAHVCGEPGREVTFTFPTGKTAHGVTLGTDHDRDAGLMKITDPGPWPHVPVGDMADVRLGDWVLALGHPGGFNLKRPVVVRLGRIIRLEPDFIQTDCTLISGDSGGPLFDMSGRVIGIHSRISVSTDANFHVPIRVFMDDWDRLARGEDWGGAPPLGTYVGAVGLSEDGGYRLTGIEANSPAEAAGLRVGDVIVEVDGQTVTDGSSYVQSMTRLKPGKPSTFRIKRGHEKLSVQVTAGASGFGGRRFGGGFRGR